MTATVEIDAGACGFKTSARVVSEDNRHVSYELDSECERVLKLAEALKSGGPIDAYQEISSRGKSILFDAARSTLVGCCTGCAVPVGLFKAMEVATGLALPKDVAIQLAKE